MRDDFAIVAGDLSQADAPLGKPLKRLRNPPAGPNTQLKQGVNERGVKERAGRGALACHSSAHSLTHSLSRSPSFLYHETVTPPCILWIAGAGHIAQAVAPLAVQLDFSVTVFDDRPALANHHYFPHEKSACELKSGKNSPRPAAAGRADLRAHRHARPPPRRARAQGLDPQTVSVSRHDRQLAQGPHHLRALSR